MRCSKRARCGASRFWAGNNANSTKDQPSAELYPALLQGTYWRATDELGSRTRSGCHNPNGVTHKVGIRLGISAPALRPPYLG